METANVIITILVCTIVYIYSTSSPTTRSDPRLCAPPPVGAAAAAAPGSKRVSSSSSSSSSFEVVSVQQSSSMSASSSVVTEEEVVVEIDERRKKFPKAIIIGTPKGGTLALRRIMGMHSKIVEASLEEANQIQFFNANFDKGYSWYLQEMPLVNPDQLIVEKTPSYFYQEDAPLRMKQMDPDVKLFLTVRDPISRLVSKYAMDVRRSVWNGTIEETFLTEEGDINRGSSYVNRGLYAKFLTSWLQVFPLSQIMIVDTVELSTKPWSVMQDAERFLGLEPEITERSFSYSEEKGFYCMRGEDDEPDCLSKGKGLAHPELPDRLKKKLLDFYRPYNEEFYQMVGRDFGWQR